MEGEQVQETVRDEDEFFGSWGSFVVDFAGFRPGAGFWGVVRGVGGEFLAIGCRCPYSRQYRQLSSR